MKDLQPTGISSDIRPQIINNVLVAGKLTYKVTVKWYAHPIAFILFLTTDSPWRTWMFNYTECTGDSDSVFDNGFSGG